MALPSLFSKKECRTQCAIATATYRKNSSDNEDSFAHVSKPGIPHNVVALADGIGSKEKSKEAAEIVTNFIKQQFTQVRLPAVYNPSWEKIYKRIRQHLRQYTQSPYVLGNGGRDMDDLFATTLLIACEWGDYFDISYVGNGVVIHIRPCFQFLNEEIPPQSISYHLNPHTVAQQGKEALYRFISPNGSDAQVTPTVLRLKKDLLQGDIIIVATDGLDSADQANVGQTDDGLWVQVPEILMRLYQLIRSFLSVAHLPETSLQIMLESFLATLRNEEKLKDDTTIGILITGEVFDYQLKHAADFAAKGGS